MSSCATCDCSWPSRRRSTSPARPPCAGVSQPTLTRALARLEKALGVRLVERTTRRVALTEAGRRLESEMAALLPRLDGALRGAERAPDPAAGFHLAAAERPDPADPRRLRAGGRRRDRAGPPRRPHRWGRDRQDRRRRDLRDREGRHLAAGRRAGQRGPGGRRVPRPPARAPAPPALVRAGPAPAGGQRAQRDRGTHDVAAAPHVRRWPSRAGPTTSGSRWWPRAAASGCCPSPRGSARTPRSATSRSPTRHRCRWSWSGRLARATRSVTCWSSWPARRHGSGTAPSGPTDHPTRDG